MIAIFKISKKPFAQSLFALALVLISFPLARAQECNIVYVTPNGTTTGAAGTKATPAALSYGLALANATDDRIFMAAGTYIISSPITLMGNITIEGGYDPISWEKSNATGTIIYRDNSNIEASPSRVVAVYGLGIANFRLQDLTIRAADCLSNSCSSYALYLDNCSDYEIVRCNISSGNAGNGSNGASGVNGIMGALGGPGENGDEQGPCCTLGGGGATGSFPGSNAGGNGGDGGERGTADCSWCGNPSDANNGYAGSLGSGTGGGAAGNGGARIVVCLYPLSCARTTTNDGQGGIDGIDGFSGINGLSGTAMHSGGFYMPSSGSSGTSGGPGAGGGGGGGGGSLGGIPFYCLLGLPPNVNGSGAGGGGGGEGGQEGTGGQGGDGGGSSFAVYVNNNGANGYLRDCMLNTGNAGLGGLGGSGGAGGPGGVGGAGGGQSNCSVGAGGAGGNGGDGGPGGLGGNGSNGIAQNLYEDPLGAQLNNYSINNLQQPHVFVLNPGATEMPARFFTNASGTIEWYFGAGSFPSNSTGNPSIAYYGTTGIKTFTLVVNGIPYTYTDFLEINSVGTGLNPSISSSVTDTICAGDMGSFTSSVTASSYYWEIHKDSTIDTLQGSGLSSISYTFDSAGTYTIIHNISTSCYGTSFNDTINLYVLPVVSPSISITSNDTSNTICENEPLTFSASSPLADAPFYQWLLNGSAASSGSPIFYGSTFSDGDQISCVVINTAGCAMGAIDTSNTIAVTVVGLPNVWCAADSFITGLPTYFAGGINSGGMPPFTYQWEFGDMTMGSGDSVSHIYLDQGVFDIQLNVIDSNGCAGICNDVVTIYSLLSASFTSSASTGCSPMEVVFSNSSSNAITYLWEFGDGNTSIEESPMYTFNSPGSYDVTLNAYGSTGISSATITNQIMVLPSPTANFQAYPSNTISPGDTLHFADNSLDAWTWFWNFGDPGSGLANNSLLQNPSHIFALVGVYDVALTVSNSYGCLDSILFPGFVTVSEDPVVSNSPIEATNKVLCSGLYPNPFSQRITLNINAMKAGLITYSIISLDGQKILDPTRIAILKGSHEYILDLSSLNLAEGVYFFELELDGYKQYHKIFKE